MEGVIRDSSGSGAGLIKVGNSTLQLERANTFTGGITINGGRVRTTNNSGLGAGGPITFGAAGTSLDLQASDVTIGALSSGGPGFGKITRTSGSGTVNLTVDQDIDTEFSGVIEDGTSSSISLIKDGSGTLTLSGANTYSGTTTVIGGALINNGSITPTTMTVGAGATLGGSGTVGGDTTISGNLSPGNSPGTLTFVGDLTLLAGATYTFEGGAPVDGYISSAGDLVEVGGTLTLTDDWTLILGSGFQDGGSVTLFTYGTAGALDLDPTFDLSGLGFIP
ncbi:MAG: autotransporter-associated beta strand repeat-containing protein, partial [Akkermansiaceae bacterium]